MLAEVTGVFPGARVICSVFSITSREHQLPLRSPDLLVMPTDREKDFHILSILREKNASIPIRSSGQEVTEWEK